MNLDLIQALNRSPNKVQMIWIKWSVFLIALIPLIRLFWLGFNDDLTANPVEFVERSLGFWTLLILLATLTPTPIRLITSRVWLLQLRRMLGLLMFFYACLHITTYVWLDFSFDWQAITQDIMKHPYILVGFIAFLLSIPLAVTSNKIMLRLLRERWKQLHQLVYLIAIFGILHFWWLVKKDIREPLFYSVILFFLLAIRVVYQKSSWTKPFGKTS